MEPLSFNGMNMNDAVRILLCAQTMSQEEKLSFFRKLLEQDSRIQSERENSLREIMGYVKQLGNKAESYENAVWLGLTLSAMLDEQDEYVGFSKMEIRLLIKQGRLEEAQNKLTEWKSILPDDPDWGTLDADLRNQQTPQKANEITEVTKTVPPQETDKYPSKWIIAGFGINNGGFLVAAVSRLMQSDKKPKIVACCDASGTSCGKIFS